MTLLVIFSGLNSSFAGSVDFPKNIDFQGEKFIRLGQGWRKATWLKVKVYKAALYSKESKAKINPLETLDTKIIEMIFVRDVGKSDLQEVWEESFKKNCGKKCQVNYAPFLKKVQKIKDKDKFRYAFHKNRVEVWHNQKKYEFNEKGFSKLLLSTWIGAHPPTDELKRDLLGNL